MIETKLIDWKNFKSNLVYLDLSYSSISDSFVFELSCSNIKNGLKTLRLRSTKITSVSIDFLSKFTNLESLDIKKLSFRPVSPFPLLPLVHLKELSVDELDYKNYRKKNKKIIKKNKKK